MFDGGRDAGGFKREEEKKLSGTPFLCLPSCHVPSYVLMALVPRLVLSVTVLEGKAFDLRFRPGHDDLGASALEQWAIGSGCFLAL